METGDVSPQYFMFLTLCLWVLHGKNRLQTAFVPPPNHQVVTEPLLVSIKSYCQKLFVTYHDGTLPPIVIAQITMDTLGLND